MASLLSPDASAQYRWGDCLRVTRLSQRPNDSVLVISVEDTCRRRTDTIYVNDGKLTNGSVVLRAPSDSSITFRYAKGTVAWIMSFDTTDADTIYFLGRQFITNAKIDTSYERVSRPDTISVDRGPIYWDEIIGKPIAATYFFHEEDSGIPGYESLLPIPAEDPVTVTTTSVSAGPSTLIHSFATDTLPASIIQPGRWDFHLYGGVNITGGSTHLEVEILKRTAGGTETSLFTALSPDINNTAIEAVEWQVYTSSEYVIESGERLVAKMYGFSTSVAAVNLRCAFEGDSASHFEVPFFTSGADANDTLFTQLRDTPNDYSGQGGKLVAVKATQDGLEFVAAGAATRQIIGYANYLGTPMDSTADYVWLVGLNGIILGHEYSITGDTIQYYWMLDWQWIKDSVIVWTAGGSGATTFLDLTDTPASYTGMAGYIPFVNAGETALEFKPEVGGGIIDTSAMFTDDIFQNVIGGWSGDTLRIQLVEWSRPVDMVHPSLVLDTTALSGIYKSIATLLFGYKKYRVIMSLQANTTCYVTLVADTANGLSIHSLTYEWTLASANISGDERLSRAAGGVRMETADTEVTNTNIWNQSTAPTITVDQTDATNNANGIRYPLDLSTRRYSVGQFPIRFLPSSGPRVVTGYIWLWFTKDKSVATPSTFDAYIQHNP